jgi:MoaA/NifB/PqqE/SkfB family radical SAM enzyme
MRGFGQVEGRDSYPRRERWSVLTEVPIYISWNYTYSCNFNCRHCYSRADAYPEELGAQEYLAIAGKLVDAGVMRVGLGGGEPLMRADCARVLSVLGGASVHTNITTNGWFLTDEVVGDLVEARLSTLYVSLDSATSDVHDEIRRKAHGHERAVAGIRRAVAAGVEVKLSTVITRLNYGELDDVVRLAEDLGVAGIEFKRFRPTGNGLSEMTALSLDAARTGEVRGRLAALAADSPLEIALFYGAESDGGADFGCPCGVRSLTLRPNGDVAPCAYAPAVIGNLLVDDLGALWREAPLLTAMRTQGACAGLAPAAAPSNQTGAGMLRVPASRRAAAR